MRFRGLIEDLIHRQAHEVTEHDVHDRAHARHCGADGEAGETGLGNRRVEDSIFTELVHEPNHDLERMAGCLLNRLLQLGCLGTEPTVERAQVVGVDGDAEVLHAGEDTHQRPLDRVVQLP